MHVYKVHFEVGDVAPCGSIPPVLNRYYAGWAPTGSKLAFKNLNLESFSENTSVFLICTLKDEIDWRVGENE